MKLLVDDLVSFAEVLPALGVADEGVRAADGFELRMEVSPVKAPSSAK